MIRVGSGVRGSNTVKIGTGINIRPFWNIISNGLVFNLDAADYSLGEPDRWPDSTGNRYDATLVGLTYNTANGGYFDFSGTESYAYLTSGFNPDFSAGITVNVWAKFSSSAHPWARLIDFGNGNPLNNIILCQDGINSSYILMDIEGVNSDFGNQEYGPATINYDQWAMYTMWADGTYWKIYKNGQFVTYQANTLLPVNTPRNSNYIGRSLWYPADQDLVGSIGSVQMYNRALTETEILKNYNALKSRYGL